MTITATHYAPIWTQPREGERIHAVLDGAAHVNVFPRLLESGLEHRCLLKGQLPADLARAAPYLVQLEPGHEFTDWVLSEGAGLFWGIFFASSAPLGKLSSHLGRLLKARTPDDRPVYFRYYDPRVLADYLPTCTPDELEAFYGPIRAFFAEDEDGTGILSLTRDADGALVRQRLGA